MEQSDFSNRLRIARGRKGYTIDQLATQAGLSATAIIDLENGRVRKPRIQTVIALADALGLEVNDLLEPEVA